MKWAYVVYILSKSMLFMGYPLLHILTYDNKMIRLSSIFHLKLQTFLISDFQHCSRPIWESLQYICHITCCLTFPLHPFNWLLHIPLPPQTGISLLWVIKSVKQLRCPTLSTMSYLSHHERTIQHQAAHGGGIPTPFLSYTTLSVGLQGDTKRNHLIAHFI